MPSGAFLSFSAFLYREVYGIYLWKIDFRIPLQPARSALDKEFFEKVKNHFVEKNQEEEN